MSKVYVLREHTKAAQQPSWVVIVPDDVDATTVSSAWSYAVRYSAKGLDVPDFQAAVKLMQERHPSWQYLNSKVQPVTYMPDTADKDEPEGD